MLDVSIIIVNYGTENYIINAIDSVIAKTKRISYEVIIVDNASPNDTFRVLEERYARQENIRCLRLDENVGFGRANNAGYEQSSGRYVLCLNPDTELRNNAIDILSDYLDNHPEAGGCGGNLFQKDGHLCGSYRMLFPSVSWEFSFMTYYVFEVLRYGRNRRYNMTGRPIDVAIITGADLMIRRSVIESTGFFDPAFFMYYEDADLCYRIRKNGYRLTSVPQAEIYHYEGKSSKNLEGKARLNFVGRNIFYTKHHSRAYCMVADALWGIAIILRITALAFKKQSNRKYWATLLQMLLAKYGNGRKLVHE